MQQGFRRGPPTGAVFAGAVLWGFVLAGFVHAPPASAQTLDAGGGDAIADRPPPAGPRRSVRGFVQAGWLRFAAGDSFEAVTGSAAGFVYGGGVQFGLSNGFFLQGSVERYAARGQRVFVHAGQVFALGIPHEVMITPIRLSAGYRRTLRPGLDGYVGAGGGVHLLEERAPFGPPDGDAAAAGRHGGGHALFGVETPLRPWLRVGGEGQWTWAPGAIGAAGAAAAFDERDLGGFTFRVKLSVGY